MTKYIPLSEWAEKQGITVQQAHDVCRRGRLKSVVKIKEVKIKRYVIPEDTPVPEPRKKI